MPIGFMLEPLLWPEKSILEDTWVLVPYNIFMVENKDSALEEIITKTLLEKLSDTVSNNFR